MGAKSSWGLFPGPEFDPPPLNPGAFHDPEKHYWQLLKETREDWKNAGFDDAWDQMRLKNWKGDIDRVLGIS